MRYKVRVKRKLEKSIKKLPLKIQLRLDALLQDLKKNGPSQYKWPHYSKLSKNEHHCHLDKSKKYVACWRLEVDKITIGVYYAGSHENAPY